MQLGLTLGLFAQLFMLQDLKFNMRLQYDMFLPFRYGMCLPF